MKFLDKHSRVAYHTLKDDKEHRKKLEQAVNNHTKAHKARLDHGKYRAYVSHLFIAEVHCYQDSNKDIEVTMILAD